MVYLPDVSSPCMVVRNDGTIRAYDQTPTFNSTINYTDYYINSHYLFVEGSQSFSNYTTLPVCSNMTFTTDVFYRNDFADILIIFVIMCIFSFYIPIKIFSRLFRRFL